MKRPKLFSMSGTSTLTASLVTECSALACSYSYFVSCYADLTTRISRVVDTRFFDGSS